MLSYPECWVRFGAFRLSLLSRSPDLENQRTGNIQFNRRLWRWLHLSRKCHAKGGKRRQKCGKRQQRKEKAGCGNLPQLAEFVRLATPLARFGKVVRTASNQRVGSSSLPGRAIPCWVRPGDVRNRMYRQHRQPLWAERILKRFQHQSPREFTD